MHKEAVQSRNMAQHQPAHLLVRRDPTLVNPDHLQSSDPSGLKEEGSGQGQDIYALFDEVEEWRRSKDLLYRLFTQDDDTELRQHVLGIIAAENTTVRPGLLHQQYANTLSPRAWRIFGNLQHVDQCDVTRENRPAVRRMWHFVLLVALCVENEFTSYVVSKTHNRDRLRYYINDVLQPMLGSLFRGQVSNPNAIGSLGSAFGLMEFVDQARAMYGVHCMPMPVNGPIPLKCLGEAQRVHGQFEPTH